MAIAVASTWLSPPGILAASRVSGQGDEDIGAQLVLRRCVRVVDIDFPGRRAEFEALILHPAHHLGIAFAELCVGAGMDEVDDAASGRHCGLDVALCLFRVLG
eukprot:GHVR01074944.1.p6 GENE.GHVR01074944.1~~GHVR01074944.1.p6  ORF type:complete len:103 (-),score=14.53 GHVR01074944.1:534-842(-)